jgi:hypothetical protein
LITCIETDGSAEPASAEEKGKGKGKAKAESAPEPAAAEEEDEDSDDDDDDDLIQRKPRKRTKVDYTSVSLTIYHHCTSPC